MLGQEKIPHILKYMGGKREMLNDIGRALSEMHIDAEDLCDLFAGTGIVSCAFSDDYNIISNDIQAYSAVFSNAYFSDYSLFGDQTAVADSIMEECENVARRARNQLPDLEYHYDGIDYEEMARIEEEQRELINEDFGLGFSFFIQNYSGTYWSFEQCLWIDSIRSVAESHKDSRLYYLIMSSLVFAMSYCAQSTGHFAQYRALTPKNYKSILLYRQKSIPTLFYKKMKELLATFNHPIPHRFRSSTLDYLDCINTLQPGTIVYADPPYSSVHYSRFYHTLETLVLYDHPRLEYKGRYREGRYQSPFDQKTSVGHAFERLFKSIRNQGCHLLLSYSNNALLSEKQIKDLAFEYLGPHYSIAQYSRDYKHMKMGRDDESQMTVQELLLAFTNRQI